MYPKPKGFNNVGVIQCFLAAFFILGLLGVWIIASFRYELNHTEIAGRQGIVYELALGAVAICLSSAYWTQEQMRRKM